MGRRRHLLRRCGRQPDPSTSGATTPIRAACWWSSPTGQTIVSAEPRPTTYTLQLTRAPTAPVTITLLDDGQTLLSSGDPRFSRHRRPGRVPAVMFDGTNWNQPVTLDRLGQPERAAAPLQTSDSRCRCSRAQPH